MRRHLVGGLAAAAVTAALLIAVYQAYARYEVDRGRYPIQGIDLSEADGPVDWDALAGSDGTTFVYLRATAGLDRRDARFDENWAEAARTGIDRGAYHAFNLCQPGAAQARAFLAAVPVDARALPPAVALGLGDDCGDRPSRDAVVAEATAFLGPVDRQYGKPAVLFVTGDLYRTYLDGAFDDRAFWLRSLIARPRYGPVAWYLWQYNDRGWRHGVGVPVNLDVFYGNAEEFESFRGAPAEGG